MHLTRFETTASVYTGILFFIKKNTFYPLSWWLMADKIVCCSFGMTGDLVRLPQEAVVALAQNVAATNQSCVMLNFRLGICSSGYLIIQDDSSAVKFTDPREGNCMRNQQCVLQQIIACTQVLKATNMWFGRCRIVDSRWWISSLPLNIVTIGEFVPTEPLISVVNKNQRRFIVRTFWRPL